MNLFTKFTPSSSRGLFQIGLGLKARPCPFGGHRYVNQCQPLVKTAARFCTSSRSYAQRVTDSSNSSLTDPIVGPVDTALIAKTDKLTCAHFNGTGNLISKEKQLSKNEIAEQFDLRHRDLRDLDLKSESVTRVLVRPATILIQFFDLCTVIQFNEVLLIDLQKIKSGLDRGSTFYHNFELRLVGLQEAADVPVLPYELRAVETAIIAVLHNLQESLIQARQEAEHNAQSLKLETGLADLALDLLFENSRNLSKIEQKARLVRDTIREVLDTDEDLAGMYLTDKQAGKTHATSDHQEAEYMLEAYHKAADGLVESAHATVSMIRKREAVFRSSLAVQRNQIMFLEAKIAIHTLGLAAGTLVAGLFGMNLVNYFEEAPYGFPVVTGVCIALSAVFSMYGMRSIRRIQSLKYIQTRTSSLLRRGE